MNSSRFLSVEGRRDYLYAHEYFPDGSIGDDELSHLQGINFHHFLGYARNYRKLVDEGHLPGPKTFAEVSSIIAMEHKVAQLLFLGLRKAEWSLRSLTVKHYCQEFDPKDSFLQESQYTNQVSSSDARQLISSIVRSTLRYGEPFVVQHIREQGEKLGINPKEVELTGTFFENRQLLRGLELWSIIDSFSMGQLGKFILQATPASEGKDEVWRHIAHDLDINSRVFHTNLQALAVLRNLVAHNVRLWMKPMPQSPKTPAIFKTRLRGSAPKSMHVSFMNVALFQETPDLKRETADEIDALLTKNSTYRYGVSTILSR